MRARQHWAQVGTTENSMSDMKRWCQQQPSKGRFYCRAELEKWDRQAYPRFSNIVWYFEFPADATFFILTWIGKNER